MKQEIIDLFDHYTHESMDRGLFLKKLARLTGGTMAAASVLSSLETNYLHAHTISPQDDELVTEYITYPGAKGEIRAYSASPLKPTGKGAVMVIHENRGLNAHIEDVARRAAKAGFYSIAPDALSPLGGTPRDQNEARSMFRELDANDNLENFVQGVDFLSQVEGANGKVGAVGFCWGGGMVNSIAAASTQLTAGSAFYGRQVSAEKVPNIKAALQLHYAALDNRINAGIADYEKALKAHQIAHEVFMYEGVNHAFHNDTSEARYDKEAAQLAWRRTMNFFNEKLA